MDTRDIQYFLALAELGSSYAAAEKLFVSQSTLIRHIQAIESEYGCMLFDRTRLGFVLNEKGKVFLPFAQNLVAAQDKCFRDLHDEEEENNTVRISADGKVTDLMLDFKKAYPEYYIDNIVEGNIEERLQKGLLDVGFIGRPINSENNLDITPFFKNELLALVSEDHHLAGRESVTLEELKDELFISLSQDTAFEVSFSGSFSKVSFTRKLAMTVPMGNDLLKAVRENIGMALIHGTYENIPERPGIRVIPIRPEMSCVISMCYRYDIKQNRVTQDFVAFAKKWIKAHPRQNTSMID